MELKGEFVKKITKDERERERVQKDKTEESRNCEGMKPRILLWSGVMSKASAKSIE